ncbi:MULTISPECIES: hypothetical protein [unclassified Streptomyces]|uniref:hypothetical protein n=1 Tax=unclassified Streptomyces TaxID=2593676 RepID=UPI002E1B217E|nr:hypothetical protein OG217_37760 [Streptomyces sp. NBC_01023]
MATYDFPPDLREAQAELHRIRAEHQELMRGLPRSVEPMDAVENPDHWYRRNHPLPASPGYTPDQREQADELQARLLEATVRVSTHPFWSSLSGGDLVAARMALKHVEAAGAEPA